MIYLDLMYLQTVTQSVVQENDIENCYSSGFPFLHFTLCCTNKTMSDMAASMSPYCSIRKLLTRVLFKFKIVILGELRGKETISKDAKTEGLLNSQYL